MAPIIGHDGKKRTVTFGNEGEGPTEGAYRIARLYTRLGTLIFVAAGIFTLMSMVMMIDFATDLATSTVEVLKFAAIAVAISLTSTLLLAWSGLIEASHPKEAQMMMQGWALLMGVAAIAGLFVVFRPGATAAPTADASRIAELNARLDYLSPTEWDAWNASNGCRAPTRQDAAMCRTINARRARDWAELRALEARGSGWSAREVVGTGRIEGVSVVLRGLFSLLLTLIAAAAGGMLTRWGAMGHAAAWRQADGIEPVVAPQPAVSAGGPPAILSPVDTAEMWFQGRVRRDPHGRISPTTAYADYVRTCEENGLPPMSEAAFCNLLAAKAKASGGAITKVKSNGKMVYQGWSMGEVEIELLPPGGSDDLLALPYRN